MTVKNFDQVVNGRRTTGILRAIAWVGVSAIIILSVVPADERPTTGFGQGIEHFAAFGLIAGVFFGLITSAVPYAMARGTRDFSSTMQLVAGRYDVLCDPQNAEKARDLLARLAI